MRSKAAKFAVVLAGGLFFASLAPALAQSQGGGEPKTEAQPSPEEQAKEAHARAMSELAEAMVLERTTLLRTLTPLRRDGLLSSIKNAQGGPKLLLSLTRAGQRKLKEAAPLWETAQAVFAANVGPKRADSLRRALLDITQDVRSSQ